MGMHKPNAHAFPPTFARARPHCRLTALPRAAPLRPAPQADTAIMQFNLRHVLADPSGDQDRPLVVRKAKARNKAGPQLHPAVSHLLGVHVSVMLAGQEEGRV